MKKIALILLAFCIAVGTVAAQDDDGIGLYVGAELIIDNLEEASDTMVIRPYVGFETSFDALDFNAELGVDIPANDDNESAGVDFNVGATYNLSISDASKLAFGLGLFGIIATDSDKGASAPVGPYGAGDFGTKEFGLHLNLGATFTQTLDFGDLYFGINVPFLVFEDKKDAFDQAELQFTAGLDMESGLGFGLTFYGDISTDAEDFAKLLDIFVTYGNEALFCGLTVGIPMVEDGVKNDGIEITPEVAYTFDFGLTLYAELPISNVGNDADKDIGIGLTIGAKFSF